MLPTVLQRSVGLRGQIGQISTFPSVGNSSGGETVVISESHVLLMSKGWNGEKEVFSNYRLHFKKLWNMVEILNSTPPPAHCSVFQSVLVVGYFLILLFFFFFFALQLLPLTIIVNFWGGNLACCTDNLFLSFFSLQSGKGKGRSGLRHYDMQGLKHCQISLLIITCWLYFFLIQINFLHSTGDVGSMFLSSELCYRRREALSPLVLIFTFSGGDSNWVRSGHVFICGPIFTAQISTCKKVATVIWIYILYCRKG